jgi:hypothetical protein
MKKKKRGIFTKNESIPLNRGYVLGEATCKADEKNAGSGLNAPSTGLDLDKL